MAETVESEIISLAEAATRLGVSKESLRNWDTAGVLVAIRTAGGHRRYRTSDLIAFLTRPYKTDWKQTN